MKNPSKLSKASFLRGCFLGRAKLVLKWSHEFDSGLMMQREAGVNGTGESGVEGGDCT